MFGSLPRQILAFACLLLITPQEAPSAAPARPLMKDFMGLNGHTVQFKPALYSAAGRLVRDYHPVAWDLPGDTSALPAWPEARNRVNWERVYGSWKESGYVTDVCLMFESVPQVRWKDLAKDSFAYAAAFAREFGPSGKRRLVESVEIGNEPGLWSDEEYRTVFENMARGLRQGDGGLRIATCALTAGPSGRYAKSLACLKGLESLCDVLTMHTYAQLENWPTWRRRFPEDPRLKDYLRDVEALCRLRDESLPGKPVWITEFGYDSTTQPQSQTGDFKQWVGCTDAHQAQWIVRSYLVFSTLPVDRAYLYFFNDEDEAALHASSGLTRHFQPKPSFYAVSHLYRTLGEFRFARIVAREPGKARVQEYAHASDPKKSVWVLWSPTGEAKTTVYEIKNPPGRMVSVQTMPLTAGEPPDLAGTVTNQGGALHVPVGESPVYIVWEARR
ncbi:MAG: hypothetical protein PHQ12_12725 [Chthoniobacteraceae bacterium]|nr:hypothetical protein [Chthoniobacteraceae bacterium]